MALDALGGVLRGATVLGFTLERFVNEVNGVWQEVVVCDGTRLILWHGEDVPPGDGPTGSMTSSLRVVPLSAVTEVGCRRRLTRGTAGAGRRIDVYLLLSSLDESRLPTIRTLPARRAALRKTSTTAGRADRSAGDSRRW